MLKCAACGSSTKELRIVVRDDYETVRGTFPLAMTDDQQDRMHGLLDSLVDGYKQVECMPCTQMSAMEVNDLND